MKYRLAVSGLLFHSYLDLLLWVFLPRTPSSSSASVSLHSPPPTGFLRGSPVRRKLFPRAPLSDFWLRWDFRSSPRFLFFLFKFVLFFGLYFFFFFHTFSRIFHISLLNSADSLSLSLLPCNFYFADNRSFSRVFCSTFFYFQYLSLNLNSYMFLSCDVMHRILLFILIFLFEFPLSSIPRFQFIIFTFFKFDAFFVVLSSISCLWSLISYIYIFTFKINFYFSKFLFYNISFLTLISSSSLSSAYLFAPHECLFI